MNAADVPVVIVGAGPTGITAATLLAQYGIDTLILERWPGPYPQPRAVHMDDEVFRIVARLGLADEFAAISRPALGLRLIGRGGTVLAEFRRDTAPGVHGFPQANMFDQPEFEALLRDNLTRHPAARLRGNAEVTDIADEGRGGVRVKFTDRDDGSEHVVTADYVLGCDGANSIVRSRIGVGMRDLKFEQRWLVVDMATESDLRQWEGVHQVCDPVRAGTYMRIGARRYRWEFRLLPGESAADFGDVDRLRGLIEPWVGGVPSPQLELLRVAEYTFRAQLADRWRRGRVFLLGDAAHLTPPFVGQGMGAGLRDAMNLSWKLAGVLDGSLPASALDTYEQERKPHAKAIIRLALAVGWTMTAGGEAGNLIRRAVLPLLHAIPRLRAKVVDSRTPRLRRSAYVVGARRLAGSLCPNTLLTNGSRLDTELGPGFTLVTTARPGTVAGPHVVHVEPGSELGRWLHQGRATAAIIRPDRTVMRAGRDAAALHAEIPGRVPIG